jgi:CheY-like chemotaxis protein
MTPPWRPGDPSAPSSCGQDAKAIWRSRGVPRRARRPGRTAAAISISSPRRLDVFYRTIRLASHVASERTQIKSVLVVEDQTKIPDLLWTYLERKGYQVVSTGSSSEAARLGPVGVVRSDRARPAVPRRTRRDRRHRRSPVSSVLVLMVASAFAEEDPIRGLALGADDFVTMPSSRRELVLGVYAVLQRGGTETGGGGKS